MKFRLNPPHTKTHIAMHAPHLLSISIVASLLTTAHAQTFWWDGSNGVEDGSGTTDPRDAHKWNEDLNWSGDADGTSAGDTPVAGEDAVFNINGDNSNYIIHINNNDRTQESLTFNGTGTIQVIRDNNPSNTASDSLILGAGGITLGATAGAVTISETGGGQKVEVEVTETMSISNNSSSLLTFNRHIIGQGTTGTRTVTIDGSGSGGVEFNGEFQNGNSTIALVISTPAGTITRLNSDSPSPGLGGGVTLNTGTLTMTDSGAFGTGDLTLNGGRYATDSADTTSDVVIGGDVLLGGESSETGGLASGLDFTGPVDLDGGTRTLTNRRSVDFFGVLSNGGVNITGTASDRTTTFFAENTYEGDTIVSLGTLALNGSGAIDDASAVSVLGAGATFGISAITAGSEIVGSLAGGSDSSVVLGNKILATGGDNTDTNFAGVISGTGGSLTKQGAGTMTLSGDNTYTGATAIDGGTLIITGATQATSAITFSGGVLGLDIANTVAAASATVDFTGQSVDITGSPTLASYTLLSASSITGTPALVSPITGYELQVVSNELLLVEVAVSDPFEEWAGGTGVGLGFEEDFNGDGVDNGLAFLLGAADPDADANGLLPTVSESGGALTLIFDCLPIADRGDATLRVAHSTDLGTWTATVDQVPDADDAVADNNVTFVVTAGDPLNSVTATIDSAAAGGGSKLFGRLQATETSE